MCRSVGELIEELIYIRDHVPLSETASQALADAANILSHNFDRIGSIQRAIEGYGLKSGPMVAGKPVYHKTDRPYIPRPDMSSIY